ncbi:IpaD/SipD/SspD family type III secretion system needle tip protein [Stenotrophomonas sp. AB1(2024)]|uniref:IpaD/SipD/SspD family type III secretion system needle tip protein n=1 Tax=Stenotrophomonas sp. AB1(2024) TaxID=3132215 RepID=UPI0030AC255A
MEITKSAAAQGAMYHLQTLQGDIKQGSLEAPALDPETRSRLLQLGQAARSARSAMAQQIALSSALEGDGLGTLGPAATEVLADSVAMEDLKRKKQKESELASALQHTLQTSTRQQTDLLRIFSFLVPQILVEEEDNVSLPGFVSPMQNPADMDMSGLIWNSHADFFAQISALLEVLKTEWLSKYQESLAKFLEFYQEFSDIMEQIKPEASGDKGDVVIDFNKIAHDLMKLMDDYGLDSNALASFSTRAQADAFVKSMGIPLAVTQSADGKFHVKINMKAVQDLVDTMPYRPNNPDGTYPVKWDSAKYNAWVSAKDSNMEQIKHVSKVLGEKLNEMTQKFDNIVKILSSSIDKMSEANNAYVHNT